MMPKLGPGSSQEIEEIGFMGDIALDHAMGMGGPFWVLLTPGKESKRLMPNSTPSHPIPVHVSSEVPGQDPQRH